MRKPLTEHQQVIRAMRLMGFGEKLDRLAFPDDVRKARNRAKALRKARRA